MTDALHALSQAQRIVQTHAWGDAVWHVWGARESNPLVLLQWESGSWTHWVRNVLPLSLAHQVWALDLPGCGDSDLPPQVSDADHLVPFVNTILDTRFGPSGVDVVGFSFGAMVAAMLAAQHPGRIQRLVLVGAPGLGLFGRDLPMRGLQADLSVQAQREVHRENLRTMMLAHDSSVSEEAVDLQVANVARDRLRRRRIARTDVLVRLQDQWHCDVHGIWGEHDALYRERLDRIPVVLHRLRSFQVVPQAGHWVQYEAAEAFHQCLHDVL